MNHPVGEHFTISQRFLQEDDFTRRMYKSGVHFGLDIACKNEPVKAPVDGTVVDVILNHKSLGNCIFFDDGQNIHRFLHNSSIKVGKGPVKEGDVMAVSGNTGMGAAYHVHWDIMKKPFVFANLLSKQSVMRSMLDPLEWMQTFTSNSAPVAPSLTAFTTEQLLEEIKKRL
jgi:murein DD-endopeptidase MepM/ murein hydrolase activator NlpD